MDRREFVRGAVLAALAPGAAGSAGERLAAAAWAQVGVTRGYDPGYARMGYPNGDVPRATGVCADVVVRAGRDALGLDLQRLVHEDMAGDFGAYPRTWGMARPDSNIDHRRVLNLETYFRRRRAEVWRASGVTAGDAFPGLLRAGDILTFRLDARLPHIAVVRHAEAGRVTVVHNWGRGAEEIALWPEFRPHRAVAQFRWVV